MRKRLDPRGLQEKASSVSLDGLENRLTALWAVLIPGVHVAVLLKGHRCTNNSASVGGALEFQDFANIHTRTYGGITLCFLILTSCLDTFIPV